MLEPVVALDRQLLLLSQQHHSPVADALMQGLASRWIWSPLLLLVLVLVWYYGWRRVAPGTGAAVAAVLAANTLVSFLLKPGFARPRPCQVPELVAQLHLPAGCSESYAFPSTHAADVAALAAVAWLVLPRRLGRLREVIVLWSVAVAYSRIYVGAHYPFDVLAGAVLGIGCAGASVAGLHYWWPGTQASSSEEA